MIQNKTILYSLTAGLLYLGIVTAVNAADGKAIYEKTCKTCHAPGVMGAPKLGDKADWAERLKQGMATLEEHAIKGYKGKKGMMPPKGGNPKLSDDEVKAAVAYMANSGK